VSDFFKDKREARKYRHRRVRRKIRGTPEKPRLVVYRSLNHIYAQIIDDSAGHTIVSASSLKVDLSKEKLSDKESKGEGKGKRRESRKTRLSRAVGEMIAEKALKKDIKKVVFDRNGYSYHGRIAALADTARKKGLQF
jgi:large subunit ribosomal protein L18